MKVSDLIRELQEFDQDATILLSDGVTINVYQSEDDGNVYVGATMED
jgi:hypothetical protein